MVGGREHLNEQTDDAPRGIELAGVLTLGRRKLAEEVLVDATKDVPTSVFSSCHRDRADEVDELTESTFVDGRACVVLRKHALETWVVAFDRIHGGVERFPESLETRGRLDLRPAGLRRNPEDVFSEVLIAVFRVGAFLCRQSSVLLFKRIGDVLEEDQAQDDALVLGSI